MPNTAKVIAGAVKEGLALWKTFLATRQEAYNRRKDKKQEKAIQYAEEAFEKVGILFEFIHDNMEVPDSKKSEFDRIKVLIYRLKGKFNKYD